MKATNRRLLLLAATVAVLGGAVAIYVSSQPNQQSGPNQVKAKDLDKPMADAAQLWNAFGGGPTRNMVNLTEKNAPDDFSTGKEEGEEKKNIKWVARLGSRAYGGP